jgi:hypothetical protein
MRILFLLLVLINLGYFMWQWPHQSNDKMLPSGPLAITPNSKVLKLLSETNNSSATGTTPSSNNPSEAPAEGNP